MFLPALVFLVQETIDPRAEALVDANRAALVALKSCRAETETILSTHRTLTQTLVARPALIRSEIWMLEPSGDKPEKPTSLILCDGKTYVRQSAKGYTSMPVRGTPLGIGSDPLEGLLNPQRSLHGQLTSLKERKQLDELKVVEPETIEGEKCAGISYRYHLDLQGRKFQYQETVYFGADHLIRKQVTRTQMNQQSPVTTTRLVRKLEKDVAVPDTATFAYTPPPGVNLIKPAVPIARTGASATPAPPRPPLLAVGTEAPDFTVYTLDGKPVKLSDYRGKTVVMDFWATWCGPCMVTMPHIEKTWQKVKNRGDIVVLGVCVWDTKEKYDEWVPKNQAKFTFPLVFDPAGRAPENIAKAKYSVSGIPTTYIIDKDGKIVASFVGSKAIPEGVEPALKTLGITLD